MYGGSLLQRTHQSPNPNPTIPRGQAQPQPQSHQYNQPQYNGLPGPSMGSSQNGGGYGGQSQSQSLYGMQQSQNQNHSQQQNQVYGYGQNQPQQQQQIQGYQGYPSPNEGGGYGQQSMYGGTPAQQMKQYGTSQQGGQNSQMQAQRSSSQNNQLVQSQTKPSSSQPQNPQQQLQRSQSQYQSQPQSQMQQSQSQPQQQQQQQSSTPPQSEEEIKLFGPMRGAGEQLSRLASADEGVVVGLDQMIFNTQGSWSNKYTFPNPELPDAPFRKEKIIQLPQALFQKLQHTSQGRQGLLPELQRAWFAIDGYLYLWDYGAENNQRLDACEHDAEGSIDCVGLVKADPNVFAPGIDYLLVVATRLNVAVLGISYKPAENLVTLIETGIKALNTTNQAFTQIAGTSSSRIFLCGGQDGCLYELGYNAAPSTLAFVGLGGSKDYLTNWTAGGNWLTNAVTSWIPSTGSRSAADEDIVSIVIDSDRKCLYALTRKSAIHFYVIEGQGGLRLIGTYRNVVSSAASATLGNGSIVATTKIVSLAVLGPEESSTRQLIAITDSGARIYIASFKYTPGSSLSPCSLEVSHIRLPMTTAYSGDSGPFPLDTLSRTLPQSRIFSGVFVAVTGEQDKSSATFVLHSLDTVGAIKENGLPEVVQAPVISGNVFVSAVAEVASPLSGNGRVERFNRTPQGLVLSEFITEVTVSTPRKFLILAQDGLQIWTKQRPVDFLKLVAFSNDRDFFQTLSRRFEGKSEQLAAILVAILVNSKLESVNGGKNTQIYAAVSEIASDLLTSVMLGGTTHYGGSPPQQDIAIPVSQLKSTQSQLLAVEAVMTQRHLFFDAAQSSAYSMMARGGQVDDATRIWESLKILVRQSIEAISFMLLLVENKLPFIVSNSARDTQQQLLNLSYETLITTPQGRQTARALVSNLMNQQLGQQISIDTISDTLQNRCGSFCNADDVILYKAMESIRKARSCRTVSERETYLHEGLQLYIRGCSSLSVDKVRAACDEFRALDYPAGCIELPLECAARQDPHGQAYHTTTEAGRLATEARGKFYDVILETLHHYDERLDATHGKPGQQDAVAAQARVYAHALNVTDVLFCGRLYEWVLQQGRHEELLQLENDTILDFLRRRKPDDEHRDLLWNYYARREEHLEAANALYALVMGFSIPLNLRVEYLALSVAQAKSSALQPKSAPVDFVNELEERSEVANIQMGMYSEVEKEGKVEDEMERAEVLQRLEEKLCTVTELFNDFAQPLNMYSSQLALFNAASFQDEAQTMRVWEAIFEEALNVPEQSRADSLSRTITTLFSRFHPSPYALPLALVLPLIYQLAFEIDSHIPEEEQTNGQEGRKRVEKQQSNLQEGKVGEWVGRSIRGGGVGWRAVWDCLLELKVNGNYPFDTDESQLYLEIQIKLVIQMWLDEEGKAMDRGGMGRGGYFPGSMIESHMERWRLENDNEQSQDPRKVGIREVYIACGDEIRRRFG